MATRAPFLTQPYGAYYHRDVPTEDEELTHVGPGTPCGEYLRRFWQPVALSKDVQELPRRVRLGEGQEEPRGPGFGQTADRPYEERQRVPGDYDAQTSIHWGVSRHGLEHLASTDGGIIMLRNILRRGIRAVQNGQDPKHVLWEGGQVIPTYSNHTVLPVPQAPTPEAEEQLLRDTGRQVAEGYLKDHASLVEHRA